MKGQKQLTDLVKTFTFLSEDFHEFEADRKLKEEIIKYLRGQVSVLHDDLNYLQTKVDKQTQYSCGLCLLFLYE